jgi:hypothetical protein
MAKVAAIVLAKEREEGGKRSNDAANGHVLLSRCGGTFRIRDSRLIAAAVHVLVEVLGISARLCPADQVGEMLSISLFRIFILHDASLLRVDGSDGKTFVPQLCRGWFICGLTNGVYLAPSQVWSKARAMHGVR